MKTVLMLIAGIIIGITHKSFLPSESGADSQTASDSFQEFSKNSENYLDRAGENWNNTNMRTTKVQHNQLKCAGNAGNPQGRQTSSTDVVRNSQRTLFLDRLLDAIEQVESNGNPNAIEDNGKAVGSFQLWPVYVDDANRIANLRYTYNDRYCPVKSRDITRIVIKHYSKGMPPDKWAIIHISPSKRMDWDRPAAKEYLRKINEVIK